jgi:hypothetical protein
VWRRPKQIVSPADLRAEGVVELGGFPGTSVLYVRTSSRLLLFHVECLRDRALDAYAVTLAVNWIEDGLTSAQVAGNLGVNEVTLRRALLAAGYERIGLSATERRGHRRMGSPRLGNRRGRIVRPLPEGSPL